MEIYDSITADAVEEGDQIHYANDYVEVSFKLDETDTILIRGWSWESGDTVTYLLNPDTEVELWRA